MSRRRNIYVRHWRIVHALHGRKFGLSIAALMEEIGTSRTTLYRDLGLLRDAGIPIASELRNGEARWFLLDAKVPPLSPTPLEVHALRLARKLLAPLDGSALTNRLDDLLDRVPPTPATPHVSTRRAPATDPTLVALLERALDSGRRTRIYYRGSRDTRARWRRVDPLGIRLVGDHVYLIAHDLEADAPRTFKVARISRVEPSSDRAATYPPLDHDTMFANSVKVWTGEPVEVAVHLAEPVAHLAREWPLLPTQTVTDTAGGVVVHATVAGLEETVRWVLGWGKHARPLEPDALVEAVRAELEGALAGLRRGRPTDRGTRGVHKAGVGTASERAESERPSHVGGESGREG